MTEKEDQVDRLSVLAKEFTPAAMEYHRREMGKEGGTLWKGRSSATAIR